MKFVKKHIAEILLSLALLAGLCLILYPTVSDWWNSLHQTRAIATYTQTLENIDDSELQQMLDDAWAYNRRLASLSESAFLLDEDQELEYNSTLNVDGSGMMGSIKIPIIDVNLAIYHGTSEEVLQVGVGHIAGSSLPVGGASTHCLLSGHRGLPSAKLFTDLNKLQVGDIFIINVVGEELTYQVDQIRIVLPEEVSDLSIVSGQDLCTLITCTPYGVNTHRMLLRGHRIANLEDANIFITNEATRVENIYVIAALAVPLMLVTTIFMLAFGGVKKRRSQRQILDDLRHSQIPTNPDDRK